jgi:rhodanese-related sulfurtransferase
MGLLNLFGRVAGVSAAEVKKKLAEDDPSRWQLLDVREPREYSQGHLPGAVNIPLSQLAGRLSEVDRDKPVVAY